MLPFCFQMGCQTSVLPYVDSVCSGRRRCELNVPQIGLQGIRPCSDELVSFMEAAYTCLPGKTYRIMGIYCLSTYKNILPVPVALRPILSNDDCLHPIKNVIQAFTVAKFPVGQSVRCMTVCVWDTWFSFLSAAKIPSEPKAAAAPQINVVINANVVKVFLENGVLPNRRTTNHLPEWTKVD